MGELLTIPAQVLIGAIAILDSLPDFIRAMLAALLLVVFLRFFESRIPAQEVHYAEAFRKTAFVALLTIPLFVWLVPSSRLVVLVEELPEPMTPLQWGWFAVLGVWALGAVLHLVRLIRAAARNRAEITTLAGLGEDARLPSRLQHWQRRLGFPRKVRLKEVQGARPRHLTGSGYIGFPGAARHWPVNAQDVLIIHALCHMKRNNNRWHTLAQLIACCYWPVSWITKLHTHLLNDLQFSADRLSRSCYQDHMGYARAVRQIEERLDEPLLSNSRTREPELQWRLPGRPLDEKDQPRWAEAYDRVFLFIGQAVFLAFLFTGVTLKQMPPEMEQDYSIWFEIDWMNGFHRNLERFEPQKYPNPEDKPADEVVSEQ